MSREKTANMHIIVLAWIIVGAWMGLIFYLSAQPGSISGQLSGGITDKVIRLVAAIFPQLQIDTEVFHYFVRKNAHFIAYMSLALFVLNAIRRSGVYRIRGCIVAFVICVLYAIGDEVHQIFVPGRSGQVTDVIIDSIGALTGIGLYLIICKSYYFFLESNERSKL